MSTNNSNISVSEKPDSLKATQFGGSHYKQMKIEPVQYALANEQDCLQFSVNKYMSRHKLKYGALDVKKAIHFAIMALDQQYGIKTTCSFSDEVQLPPDNPNELHGPGGEIDLREHGPGVDVDTVETKAAKWQVREVYPRAWATEVGRGNMFAIEHDKCSSEVKYISCSCKTAAEAWQSALNRIHQSQVGSSVSNASISTPAPLPSNSLQPHVAAHPPAAIRASESSGCKVDEPGVDDFQSY